jgi:hypothetical protein
MSKPLFYADQALSFPPGVERRLGSYVYVLRDPRDRKVFYVGKGGGNNGQGNERLFDHFITADKIAKQIISGGYSQQIDPKTSRILEIWSTDQAVEWYIIRHNLDNSDKVLDNTFHIEAAIIDVLSIDQNGPALNIQGGHQAYKHGILSPESANAYGAPPVNPITHYQTVFIFPIQAALASGATPYQATRAAWAVSETFRNINKAMAVGIANRISQGVFEIDVWKPWTKLPAGSGRTLWEFDKTSTNLPGNDLLLKDFTNVIAQAMGSWQFATYLIVEFDGKGKFRFLRGSLDKTTWFDL